MSTSGAWDLSPGLPSRKAWLSSQTNKQSGPNMEPDETPPGITPQATVVRLSPLVVKYYPYSPLLSSGEGY